MGVLKIAIMFILKLCDLVLLTFPDITLPSPIPFPSYSPFFFPHPPPSFRTQLNHLNNLFFALIQYKEIEEMAFSGSVFLPLPYISPLPPQLTPPPQPNRPHITPSPKNLQLCYLSIYQCEPISDGGGL